jgi:hypothetical protein
VAFRTERKRLDGILAAGEEILASDPLSMIGERPELTVPAHPVLVVTTAAAYLLLHGPAAEVRRLDLDTLVAVARTDEPKLGSTLQLTLAGGEVCTYVYEPRQKILATADRITERFFGRIVTDTGADTEAEAGADTEAGADAAASEAGAATGTTTDAATLSDEP